MAVGDPPSNSPTLPLLPLFNPPLPLSVPNSTNSPLNSTPWTSPPLLSPSLALLPPIPRIPSPLTPLFREIPPPPPSLTLLPLLPLFLLLPLPSPPLAPPLFTAPPLPLLHRAKSRGHPAHRMRALMRMLRNPKRQIRRASLRSKFPFRQRFHGTARNA